MYRALDAALARASVHVVDTDLPACPDITGDGDTGLDLCRDWLRQVWSDELYAEAIAVASPVLAAQVRRACDGQVGDPRRMRRTVASVLRYLLRMTGRSTPFGLFAGVAAARFGKQPSVRWGRQHRAVIHADAAWLASVIFRLEGSPQLLRRLPVVVNSLCAARGDRLILPFQEQTPGHAGSAEQTALSDVSVRYGRAVEAVLRYASEPINVSDLVGKLTVDFPHTSTVVIEGMLANLVRLGFLLTGLRAPMTVTDGLKHMVALLRAVGAATVPEVADLVRELYAIDEAIARHNRTAAGEQPVRRARLTRTMLRLDNTVEQPLMLDLRLDLDVMLPDAVARDAQAAAAVLTRLTPYPHGLPAWEEYHGAFLKRYGVGAVVPLLDLVDPDVGLGFPATYRGSQRTVVAVPLSERDRRLLTLIQRATVARSSEIALDDRMVCDIAGEAEVRQVPPHVELFTQVHADSEAALRRGNFTLLVTGAARAAGATTGRFIDLLDESTQDRFRDAYAQVATSRARAVPAQVSCPPLRTRSQTVARSPAILACLVSAGEHRPAAGGGLPLTDLAVGGDTDGFYLVSLSRRMLVEPTVLNAVEFRHFSHPLTRFLCELSRARSAVYMPFDWGAAAELPFLPRVRYGRTVLAPARWNLVAADLPGSTAPWSRWRSVLMTWRRQFRVPAQVYLVEADNLLRLDLGQEHHLVLLRSHLDRYGQARLDEAPPPDAYKWLDGHTHEIVIPLTTALGPLPAPAQINDVCPVRREDAHLPGNSPWLFAKLYCQASRHTDILTDLAEMLSQCDTSPEWWYVPYLDPEPHLRIRIHLPDVDGYGRATRHLGGWATRLRQRGLLGQMQLDTYYPETGRYGHGAAMTAAEHVFAADSAAALAQRQIATSTDIQAEALAVASLVDLTIAFTGDTAAGMRWLDEHVTRDPAPTHRALHQAALRLADPFHDWASLSATSAGGHVIAVWHQRRVALAEYRQILATQRDPMSVLPSLLHMHQIRMFGIDPERERVGLRLARAAAHRWVIARRHTVGQRQPL